MTVPTARPLEDDAAPTDEPVPTDDTGTSTGWWVAMAVAVVVCFGVGLGLRLWILQSYVGLVNSDEATTGLMALDILRGHLPVLVAGNAYGGTLESFVAAPVFALTGASGPWLKGLNLAEWLAAAALVYAVARLVLSRFASLAAAAVFWVASGAVIYLSTLAYAGYATGICAYLGAFWVAGRQALAERPSPRMAFLAGLLAGVAVWLHPMFVALMLPALLVVTWRHRRALVAWLVPVVAGGVLALLPMVVFNVANDWPSLDDPYPQYADVSYGERLWRFATQLLPRTLGQRDLTGYFANRELTGAWVLGPAGTVVFAVLLGVAVAGLVVLARRSWAGRMLAVSALVTPFVLGLFSALSFYEDGRYSINFVVFLVLGVVAAVDAALRRWPVARRAALVALPVVWLAVAAVPATRNIVPAIERGPDDEMIVLTRALDAAGIRDVRAEYWIAYRLAFYTDERIRTAVIPLPGASARFPAFERAVDAAGQDRVAWVFFGTSLRDDQPPIEFDVARYDRQVAGPYIVYVPKPDA